MAQGTLTRDGLAAHAHWSRALASPELAPLLVLPLIVADGGAARPRPDGAAGAERLSITEAVREARAAAVAGIAGVLLLGASERKDEQALLASERHRVVPRAIRAIKDALPELAVATDVCVCAYTAHGQCVLFGSRGPDLDATRARLAEIALAHAEAGADLLVSTGMLEGAVAEMRTALDASGAAAPLCATVTLESALYGPDRAAVGAVPVRELAVPLVPPADAEAAYARAERDLAAGADAVGVRPGLLALDVLAGLARRTSAPLVSLHPAAEHALFTGTDDIEAGLAEAEALAAAWRAGAHLLISYGALAVADAVARSVW
jgi:porphobilinogen synthase